MLKNIICSFAIIILFSQNVHAQNDQPLRLWGMKNMEPAELTGFWNSDGTSTSAGFKDAKTGILLKTAQGRPDGMTWGYLSPEDRTYLKGIYRSIILEKDIHLAARLGDFERVKTMLESGHKPKRLYKDGTNLVFLAAEGGNSEIIDLLYDNKFKIDVKNNTEETPLHWAAMSGHVAMVAHLIDKYQLSVSAETEGYCQNPIYYAVKRGHVPVVRYLVEQGSADILSFNGQSSAARAFGLPQKMSDRVFGKARVVSPPGYLLLCAAAQSGNPEMVRFLIENGASTKDHSGETILQYAIKFKLSPAVIQYLTNEAKLDPDP